MTLHCGMTGKPVEGPGDAIWDGGEWISWDYINEQLYEQEEAAMLERLIKTAKDYLDLTGRHLPVYGEIGELYAERRFGITRHQARAQGSDGRLDDDFVEIKTISPEKRKTSVQVKRAGHFNKLCLVKIDEDFRIDARMIARSDLPKGTGKFIRVRWEPVGGHKAS